MPTDIHLPEYNDNRWRGYMLCVTGLSGRMMSSLGMKDSLPRTSIVFMEWRGKLGVGVNDG